MAIDYILKYGNVANEKTNKSEDITAISPIIAEPVDSGLIDVISDCQLFANKIPEAGKSKIPYIFFEEFDLTGNPLLTQFQYLNKFLPGFLRLNGGGTPQNGQQTEPQGGLGADTLNYFFPNFTKALKVADGDLSQYTDEAVRNIYNQLKNIKASSINENFITLSPYSGMYALKPTNFQYIMPYYDNKMQNIGNKFNDSFTSFFGGEGTGLSKAGIPGTNLFEKAKDLFGTYLTLSNITQPSAYVEFPKYFAPGEYETYTVKFQLLNTIEQDAIQKHYDFLFLLAFQNLPFRESIIRVRPCKLYFVVIPGTLTLPYCFMESINIDYVGNRRMLQLDKFNFNGNKIQKTKTECIVPDCYSVTITFRSLLRPASNFMLTPNINVRTAIPTNNIEPGMSNIPPTLPTPTPVPTPPTPAPSTSRADNESIVSGNSNPRRLNVPQQQPRAGNVSAPTQQRSFTARRVPINER